MAFEVVYYPTAEGWCNFVVDAKVVEDAMKIKWNPGLRIKLSLKKDNSSKRCSNFEGTISAPNRPWHMLEVYIYLRSLLLVLLYFNCTMLYVVYFF